MNKRELAEVLTFVCACFPQFEATEQTVIAWGLLLSDYHFEDVKEAILNFVRERNSAFAPTISQVIAETKAIMAKRLKDKTNIKLFKDLRKELTWKRRPVALVEQFEKAIKAK